MNSSRSGNVSVSLAYQTALEDLTKLLQDTESSVEQILSRYNAACAKPSGPEVPDVRTSLSIGITPSILNNIGHTSPAESHNLLCREGALGGSFGLGPFPTPVSKAAHHQHDAQNWFVQKQPGIAGHGRPSFGNDAPSLNKEGTFSDEDALRVLLEEMKKTVCDWSCRQKVLVQDKVASTRGVGVTHGGVAVRSPLHLPNGAPPPLGFKDEWSPAVSMEALGGSNPGEKEALLSKNEREVEKTCIVLPQQDKEAGHALFEAELQNSARLDKVVDDIASQLLQSDDEDSHQGQSEQPMATHTQHPSEKERAGQAVPVAQVCGEQGSNSQATALATDVNAAGNPVSKEVIPVADSFTTPTKTDETGVKLPLTKWKPPTSAAKTNDKNVSFPRTVEVIDSPDWLPEGWVTELKTRGSGNSAGSKDKYYFDPISQRRFRSRKEVVAYLERGKPKLSDSPETSPVKKLLGPEFLSSPPKKSHKKAKLKESSILGSSGLAPPMVPTIASPGLLGNMFMPPPYRTGQPSEWLVYESLASLPFPMFDPFYYADLAANKSGTSKGTHMPRPWFFSGPEASWSPFMDRTKAGDKGRDYHGYYSMPPYSSDAAPKPPAGGSSKKSSKRKSTGL